MVFIFLLCITGCATPLPKSPDLSKVFEGYRDLPKKEPVIFIPGLFGSVLIDENGKIIWGEKRSVFRQETINQALLLPVAGEEDLLQKRNTLQPSRLIESLVWVPNLYEIRAEEGLIKALQEVGGYSLGDIQDPDRNHNFYYFSYDWRRDIAEQAAILHDRILAIKEAWRDHSLKVNLIGHSMGGLIGRYYVKYGNRDLLDLHWLPPPTFAGAQHVKKLIVVGTPHMGSTVIVGLLQYGLPMWHIRPRINPETMLTWPSMYQLLPSQPSGLFLDENKEPIQNFNIFDIETWEKYQFGIFSERMMNRLKRHYGENAERRKEQLKAFMIKSLKRAARFHKAIEDVEGKPQYPLSVIGFGGDCLPTPEYTIISSGGDVIVDRDDLFTPGDGSVSRSSFLGRESYILTNPKLRRSHVDFDFTMFICETHSALTENPTFHDNLLHVLLTEGHLTQMEGNEWTP